VTPDFQRAFRALGCAIGWKNAARRVAYGPTVERVIKRIEKRERSLDAQDRQIAREEAEAYLATDNPVLAYCDYRKVWRFRRPRAQYGALPERPRPTPIEQVTVTGRLAVSLKERGVQVNRDKSGRHWADVEDEVWGADCWLTECFGERYGQGRYTFDNALTLLREADSARRFLKGK
jgi:hypothetical protein